MTMLARHRFVRDMTVALLGLTALVNGALAQSSSSETLTVHLVPYDCAPAGAMTVNAIVSGTSIEVPYGGGSAANPWLSFQLSVANADCSHWTVMAQLDDFALSSDTSTTFPASTFGLTRSDSGFTNPQRGELLSQPQWVRALPADLATGDPIMPTAVTFIESSLAGTASGNVPLLTASTAEYGTPGNSTAYFWMNVRNVPSNVDSGIYHSEVTVTIQGGS